MINADKDLQLEDYAHYCQSDDQASTWGKSPQAALDNSIALEMCATMALMTWQLNPDAGEIPGHILNKHHERKHGLDAYYGQQ